MATKKTNTRNVTIAMMVAVLLAAIEGTIVSTAMPKIVSDLGGIELFSWVFAVYLLTSAVSTPIYGKLSDLFGRKIIFTIGTILFLVGSMLSGLSQTMEQLILFRAFQGLGAGAVLPITFTIIGDIYEFEQRAKVQGLFSGIWGIAGILGPLVGGFIVDYVSWRWIFYINLPFGLISIFLLWVFLHEDFEKKKHHIDYWGAITFTIGISTLLYALLSGGSTYAWSSLTIIGLFILSALFIVLFLYIQMRSPEPMLPLKLFRIPVIAVSNLSGFLISTVLIAITVYIPMWIQGVYGQGATNSGFTLMPMSIGWPIGATICGQLLVKHGVRSVSLFGTVAIFLGSIWLAFINMASPQWHFVFIMLIVGFGFGFAMTAFTVIVQSSVEWKLRGAATASSTFIRILGQTVGVAVLGTLFNQSIIRYMSGHLDGMSLREGTDMNKLLNPESAMQLPPEVVENMRHGLASGMQQVFLVVAILAAVGFIVTFWLPKHKPEAFASAKINTKTKTKAQPQE